MKFTLRLFRGSWIKCYLWFKISHYITFLTKSDNQNKKRTLTFINHRQHSKKLMAFSSYISYLRLLSSQILCISSVWLFVFLTTLCWNEAGYAQKSNHLEVMCIRSKIKFSRNLLDFRLRARALVVLRDSVSRIFNNARMLIHFYWDSMGGMFVGIAEKTALGYSLANQIGVSRVL